MKLAMRMVTERYLYRRVKTGRKNQITTVPVISRTGKHNSTVGYHNTGITYKLLGEVNSLVRAYKT